MNQKQFAIYILTNKYNNVLYTGVTSNLPKRIYQHKEKFVEGFTSTYNVSKLVWYELAENAEAAIGREKQIKGWTRAKKIALIESMNPKWNDLSKDL